MIWIAAAAVIGADVIGMLALWAVLRRSAP